MHGPFLASLAAGIVGFGLAAPAFATTDSSRSSATLTDVAAVPLEYVDDPDYPVYYASEVSTSNCGENPSCDLMGSAYVVLRTAPSLLYAFAVMETPTDATLPADPESGVLLYVNAEGDWSRFYGLRTRTMTYPLDQPVSSPVVMWNGDSWEPTIFTGSWTRYELAWVATIPWQQMNLQSASLRLEAFDAQGSSDYSPSTAGTPVIPIAALVAGAPGQPRNVVATPGTGEVAVTWTAPVTTGIAPISSYTVNAWPSGATCTTSLTTCTLTTLPNVTQTITVRATNSAGTGPASEAVSATPIAPLPLAPTDLRATYKVKGKKATATVTWKRPANANSVQVRWALNGKRFTSWKSVMSNKVSVLGLVKRKSTTFEVRAINSAGPGQVARLTLIVK